MLKFQPITEVPGPALPPIRVIKVPPGHSQLPLSLICRLTQDLASVSSVSGMLQQTIGTGAWMILKLPVLLHYLLTVGHQHQRVIPPIRKIQRALRREQPILYTT